MKYQVLFYRSIVAGILSALACIIYDRIYFFATMVDYTKVLNKFSMTGYCMAVCVVLGLLYWLFGTVLKRRGPAVFNFFTAILSFACVMVPISANLPMDVKFPELFPGLAVPMVFFPLLAWHTVGPLFKEKSA